MASEEGNLDARQLAARLGTTVDGVHQLVRDRKIAFIRLSPRRLRFRPCDVEEFERRHRVAAVWEAR